MSSGTRKKQGATVDATVTPTPGRGPKPAKPYPDFPLYAHNAGVWAKTIRGRTHYFGPWSDPYAALDAYLARRDHLHAGVTPPADEGLTLDELVNRWLAFQRDRRDRGDISTWHYDDCLRDGARVLEVLGRARPVRTLVGDDFNRLRAAIGRGKTRPRNATTISGIVVRVRSMFAWAAETAGLIEQPPNYGGHLSPPSARARRRALRETGPRLLTAEQIRTLIAAADPDGSRPRLVNLHAMLWLGINAALGNSDCSNLCEGHVDADARVLALPRSKTDADRRAILWPQTLAAIDAAVQHRDRLARVPRELADRVFVTRKGRPYVHASDGEKGRLVNVVSLEFRRLAIDAGIHRPGLGFYWLRHTFRTVADATRDWPAVDLVMGHRPDDNANAPFAAAMGDRYRHAIADERLAAVSEHVRKWLLGDDA